MYKILGIKLKGFDGFRLNGVAVFRMTVTQIATLVLGRNGSGKSRLLRQLLPCAPDKSDFSEGGYRELDVEFDGVRYQLVNKLIGSSIKNSIINLDTNEYIVNNVNPTLFNLTVAELFRITRDLEELMLGHVKLTSMGKGERKKWFSLLSDSDLTYALSFYKKAKDNARDLTGALRNVRQSIGEIKPTVLETDKDYDELVSRVALLRSDIDMLHAARSGLKLNASATLANVEANIASVDRISSTILKRDVNYPGWVHETTLSELELKRGRLEGSFTELIKTASELQVTLDLMEQTRGRCITDVEADIQELDDICEGVHESLEGHPNLVGLDVGVLLEAERDWGDIREQIETALNALKTDLCTVSIRGRIESYSEAIRDVSKIVTRIDARVDLLNAKIEHAKHVHTVECGKCNHAFKPGIDEEGIKAAEAELVTLYAEHETHTKTIAEIVEARDSYYALETGLNLLSSAINSGKQRVAFKSLLMTIYNETWWHNVTADHFFKLREFSEALVNAVKLSKLMYTRGKLVHEYDLLKATSLNDWNAINAKKSKIDEEVGIIQTSLADVNDRIKVLKAYMSMDADLAALGDQLENLVEERGVLESGIMEQIHKEVMDEHHDELWTLYSSANQRLSEMQSQRSRLAQLEADMEIYERRLKAANAVINAMSPESGVLAKHLFRSITEITALMTNYIKRIWSYEMTVKPCNIEDGDLDYKFPFHTDEGDGFSKDVSESSLGQREIVDFVFMLAVYRALGLDGYPLFLDELGKAFDEGHKPEMINFVKSLLSRGWNSQLFMVSHDSSTHFSLSNAEVCVIDTVGVTLPEKYNQNVEMRYL